MTSAPLRAALYSNGKTPLFLDTAEITFTFADGPPITAQVQIARVDYIRNLHTILRLPTGIFYAQGVKTNVLFFARGKTDKANTKAVWIYDLRNQMEAFGKTRPLTVKDFAEFEKAFGDDPLGKAKRKDQGEEGRFQCFARTEIKARNDNLDISWLRDTEMEAEEHLTEPEDIAAAIIGHLRAALGEIEELTEELEGEEQIAAPLREAAE